MGGCIHPVKRKKYFPPRKNSSVKILEKPFEMVLVEIRCGSGVGHVLDLSDILRVNLAQILFLREEVPHQTVLVNSESIF